MFIIAATYFARMHSGESVVVVVLAAEWTLVAEQSEFLGGWWTGGRLDWLRT